MSSIPDYITYVKAHTENKNDKSEKKVEKNIFVGISISENFILISEQHYNIINFYNKNEELNLCIINQFHENSYVKIEDFETNFPCEVNEKITMKCITENDNIEIELECCIGKYINVLYPNIVVYRTETNKNLLNGGILINNEKIYGICFKVNNNFAYFLPSVFVVKYIMNFNTKICGLAINFKINNDNELVVVNNYAVKYGTDTLENDEIIVSIDGYQLNEKCLIKINNIHIPLDTYIAIKYEENNNFIVETKKIIQKKKKIEIKHLTTRSVESYLGIHYKKQKEYLINNLRHFELSVEILCQYEIKNFENMYNNEGKKSMGFIKNNKLKIIK